jgi:putative RNA 2'-phosphotransferase
LPDAHSQNPRNSLLFLWFCSFVSTKSNPNLSANSTNLFSGRALRHNDKQRFALSEDGLGIRATYGHSVAVDLGLEPVMPPEILFHGTATGFIDSIKKEGLRRRTRLYVHLSPDEHTAIGVGRRHGNPVVLTVKALRMHEKGFKFYRSDSGIWLTNSVPAEYIIFPGS